MKRRELPAIVLSESDRLFWNGPRAVRLETRGSTALALTILDEGPNGRLTPHPSQIHRIALECGAALDVAEVLGRLTGIRAMVLDPRQGAPVPLTTPGVEGGKVHLAPGRVRKSGATLTMTERGKDGRIMRGAVSEVLIPAIAFLTLARALRRWGLKALDADEESARVPGRRKGRKTKARPVETREAA